MKRQKFILGSLAALSVAPVVSAAEEPETQLVRIERATGGRLGLFAIDTESARIVRYNADERFPMCSTFKALLVAHVLRHVDAGWDDLGARVSYRKADLLEYAPVTSQHVARGWMTVSELCGAAIEYSDNTAANLLLRRAGGPGRSRHSYEAWVIASRALIGMSPP